MVDLVVAFQERDKKFWWDNFTKNPYHCFIIHEGFRIDYRFNNIGIKKACLDDLKGCYGYKVEVKEWRWIPVLTCAGFCASMIGINGLIITPNQLKKRIIKDGRCIRF